MQLGSDAQIPDGLLAARVLLNEKPRLGFRASESTLYQGLEAAKYLNRVGVATTVVRYSWQMSYKAQQSSPSGKDFLSRLAQHFGNFFHGRSWSSGMNERITVTLLPPKPIDSRTAVADAAGLIAAASKSTPLGYAGAVVSVTNDRSSTNLLTNGLGLFEGFAAPMAITGAFNDFLDYGIHHSHGSVPLRDGPIFDDDPNGDKGYHGSPVPDGGGISLECQLTGRC